jgi:hypothetical protein
VLDRRVLRKLKNYELDCSVKIKLNSTEFTKDKFIREVQCTVPVTSVVSTLEKLPDNADLIVVHLLN